MSGYRTLHRETGKGPAIWNVATSPLLINSSSSSNSNRNSKKQQQGGQYRVWTATADGLVRSYRIAEKTMHDKQDDSALDASALSMHCSHLLVGSSQDSSTTTTTTAATVTAALGCTQVCLARNYVGEDDASGDLMVASLDMAGTVRLWNISENEDGQTDAATTTTETKQVKSDHEFRVENATGTVMMICPPTRWAGSPGRDVTVAVACLDGTVAQVATGWLTPQKLAAAAAENNSSADTNIKVKEPTAAGTVLDRWGSRGSSIALIMASHPVASGVVAVGRQDGLLDILVVNTLTNTNSNTYHREQTQQRRHRFRLPGHGHDEIPIRAVTYTPDGHLLAAGNDAGAFAVWDVSRPSTPAVLVHHVVQAHASWVLGITALSDSRRWMTCGADRKLHVWQVDQMYQPVHTFDTDQMVWTMGLMTTNSSSTSSPSTMASAASGPSDKSKMAVRLVAGTETGGLQILSLDS